MYNIVLVCTHHSEFGKCNSDELYKIIESIRPDVIFEELAQDLFDRFYQNNNIPFDTPETRSVKSYIQNHTIRHFPVDINLSDTLSSIEIKYMFNTFNSYAVYSKIEADQKKFMLQDGYSFLNSKRNEDLNEKKNSVEIKLIEEAQINKERISRIHELFYEVQHKREHQIIRNIYNYSEKIVYNQALLLLGSGHRKSIFEKIKKYESENHPKLNWALYGN